MPLDNPDRLANLGWLLVHPVAGLIGFFLYCGKTWAVRYKQSG